MSRYQFELATSADDAALRDVIRRTAMDGDLSLSFQREPSYFAAGVVHGPFSQTVIGREHDSRRIVGFGVRSVRQHRLNGRQTPVGYLSALRILPEYRNLSLLARGYRFFSELHEDQRTSIYFTTIAEGNESALSVLTSGRAGLPPYHEAGRYHTLVIPGTSRPPRRQNSDDITVRPARESEWPELLSFWQEEGAGRQLFPCYTQQDFFNPAATFRDLAPQDVFLARRDGVLAGTFGLWNQQSFRQTVVERYSRRLAWFRRPFNLFAKLRKLPPLPPAGSRIPYSVAALSLIRGDDPAVLTRLLQTVRHQLGNDRHLMWGLHESDPLLPVARQYAVTSYVTRLYFVCWDDGEPLRNTIDDRPVYLEVGTL